MGRPRKDEFADLGSEWKDGVVAMSKEDIDKAIAEVAKAEEENLKAKKEDQDLANAKETAKLAGEGYRESSKIAKLRIRYCMRVLSDRGRE